MTKNRTLRLHHTGLTSVLGVMLFATGPNPDLLAREHIPTHIILAGEQAHTKAVVATLPNGLYQFCSQPEPPKWPLGVGMCFWFHKMDQQVVGYFGFPHSSHFIDCISGEVNQNTVTGMAVAIPWPNEPWEEIPDTPLNWDDEGFLTLGAAQRIEIGPPTVEPKEVIQFGTATLQLEGFYRYSRDKVRQMQPPLLSCAIDQF